MDELLAYSLSDVDIMTATDNEVVIINYDDITKYRSIDKLLGPFGFAVILYPTGLLNGATFGHWCCIFKTEMRLEYFDSYGKIIDSMIVQKVKRHLTKLMIRSSYNLTYNEHQFQARREGINTCGRWVISRWLDRDLSLSQFKNVFRPYKKYSKDEMVCALTRRFI